MVDGGDFLNEVVVPEVFNNKNLTKSEGVVNKVNFPRYLSSDEIHETLDSIPNAKHKLLFIFLWMTGLRVGEVISIRKRDIDWASSMMTVVWLKNRKKYRRVVPLHKNLRIMLSLSFVDKALDDFLFPYTRQYVWQLTRKYWGGDVHPHTFRHSFAINYIKQGDSPHDLLVLKKLLGHGRIETTLGYLDIMPVDQARQLNKVKF